MLIPEFGKNWFEIILPILTVSEANGGAKKAYINKKGKTSYKPEHWTDGHKRHKAQKEMTALMLRPHRHLFHVPCRITLTRYASRKLDRFDNLPMSLKYILDMICAVITDDYRPGRADDNEQIDVVYKQILSKEYAVKIKIEMLSLD